MIGYGQGPMMAATDSVQVTLYGLGGHGSQPENTIDPVVMAAAVVMRLQGIVAREVSSAERAVVTIGRLQAGTKENIIPATAELGINVRAYTPQLREPIPQLAASEDVGLFGDMLGVPTVFWFWGGVDAEVFAEAINAGRLPPGNHSPLFAPEIEPTLTTGVQALTTAALTWLGPST